MSNLLKSNKDLICYGRKLIIGQNDFESQKKEHLKYWDYENNVIKPSEITESSHKEINWKCPTCFAKWTMSVNRFTNQKGCPYCLGRRVLKGYNDLESQCPDLMMEWDYDNNVIKPDEVTIGSGKVALWKCNECGRSYKSKIYDRTRNDGKKSSCPFCNGRTLIKGYNDLESQCPDLIKEWNYDKNINLKPDEIGKHSTRKVWWKCTDCGHEWITTPENRVRDKNGCPKCNSRTHTSFPEQAVFYYLKKQYPDAINSYKEIFDNSMELDIYIPSKKIAIEYDGYRWHYDKKSKSEHKKYEICKKNNIKLIRIVEKKFDGLEKISDEYIISNYVPFKYQTINSTIYNILLLFGLEKELDIDADRDASKIQSLYLGVRKEKSVLSKYPELKQQWNFEKNKGLNPDFFTPKSSTKVWWICPICGKDFEQRIRERTVSLKGCQKCSYNNRAGKKVIEVETGKIFHSEKEVSIYLNLSHSYTSHIIRNNIEINGKHYKKIDK